VPSKESCSAGPLPLACSVGLAGLLVLCTLLAYSPVLSAGYVWDDPEHVVNNVHLRSPAGLWAIWLQSGAIPQYYPLVHTTFWIEYHLWRLSPFGYHFDNILLHALGALLFWRVLRGLHIPGAMLAAFVFALHPVHLESVAWVTERKNVLSTVLYLLSLLLLLRHMGLDESQPSGPSRLPYWLALVTYWGALLSKTVTCLLPVAVLILLWWRHRRVQLAQLLPLLPFFVGGLIMGSVTTVLERYQVGALGADWNLSFAERVLVAGRALWFYLGKLLWPSPLMFIYPRWTLSAPWAWLYPLAAVVGLGLLMWLTPRIGTGALAAALFYIVTLAPALGFFNVYPMRFSFVADHFVYLASLGPIALFAAAYAKYLQGLPGWRGKVATLLGVVLVSSLAILTIRRTPVYANEETLWRDTLSRNPACWLCQTNLGAQLARTGRMVEASQLLEEAVRLKPDCLVAQLNLSAALIALGKMDKAMEHIYVAFSDPGAAAYLRKEPALRRFIASGIRRYREEGHPNAGLLPESGDSSAEGTRDPTKRDTK